MAVKTSAPLTAEDRAELLPRLKSLSALRAAAAGCRACPLWKNATQTVFGAGSVRAEMVLVGEQPGDKEDQEGHPFVGPAGGILRKALHEAGIDPAEVYITNAVKHFKFERRGKRRIHEKPNGGEVRACQPWFKREMELIEPKVVVLLGATAGLSVLGKTTPIAKNRGKAIPLAEGGDAFVTVHPSYLLRIPDKESKAQAYRDFVRDLKRAAAAFKT
ncbi:MAG: UdgX family uracil-DNA binding protein [Rhodospirillaceae bacterium]